MRADRLLRVLLLLQTRGRMTANELADNLEVSVRTVQRDMDALSAAGVPVYATRGGEGGWQLVAGFTTTLTGLTPNEALAVAIGRPDSVFRELGIDAAAGELKVFAALSELAQEAARHARQRVHVDLDPWGPPPTKTVPTIQRLYEATSLDRIASITYGARSSRFDIAPLGLVAKGVVWYLVALRADQYRTYRVSRVGDVTVTDRPFTRPTRFDLVAHWKEVSANLIQTFPSYVVKLRVTDTGMRRLGWTAGTRIVAGERDRLGWTPIEIDLENMSEATAAVLGLGEDVVVLGPPTFKAHTNQAARRFVANNR